MKQFRKLLLSSLFVASLGLTFVNFHFNSVEKAEVADASNSKHTTGFYRKINNIDHLQSGVTVALFTSSGALSNFVGNPASPEYLTSNIYFSEDSTFMGADDSPITDFAVQIVDGKYTFRGTMDMRYASASFDVLLGYDSRGSSTDFPDLGYFDDNHFGAFKYSSSMLNDSRVHWIISSNDDEFTLTNSVEPNCSMTFSIYVKDDGNTDIYEPEDKPGGDFDDYYIGDTIRLDGYYAYFANNTSSALFDGFNLFYREAPDLFYMKDDIVKSGVTTYEVFIHGLKTPLEFKINEPTTNPNYNFTFESGYSSSKDYRGSYLVVSQADSRYFKGRYPSHYDENSLSCTINNGVIPVSSKTMLEDVVIIEKEEVNGESVYVMKNKDSINTLYYSNPYYQDSPSGNVYFIETTYSVDESNILTIKEENGGIMVGFTGAYNYFYGLSYDSYDKDFFFEREGSYSQYPNAVLYKLSDTQELQDDLNRFVQQFVGTINCDPAGITRYVFTQHWESIKQVFDQLSADAKGYLANLTYNHNAETKDSVKDIIDRYDYIISKYTDLPDFIGRKTNQSYHDYSAQAYLPVINDSFDNLSLIIVTVSLISISSFALVGISLKKKKQK